MSDTTGSSDFEAVFDPMGAWVQNELADIDAILANPAKEAPIAIKLFRENRQRLLDNPQEYFDSMAESMRIAHEHFPALAKIMMENGD